MKFTTVALSAAAIAAASVSAHSITARAVNAALIPDLGHSSGLNPNGSGGCDGIANARGVPVSVPCACPPARGDFVEALNANVAAGFAVNNPSVAVTFPEDDTPEAHLARLDAAAATLLNLFGPNEGCPLASTTLSAQKQALQGLARRARAPSKPVKPVRPIQPVKPVAPTARTKLPPLALPTRAVKAGTKLARARARPVVPAKPVKPVKPGKPTAARTKLPPPARPTRAQKGSSKLRLPSFSFVAKKSVDPQLVPDFGVARGARPDGHGNCKGVNNINIPCSCPPLRAEFLAALNANVAAGHATKNPGVKVSFPTGRSKADQQARISTLLVTLQNIHGPGVGCPAVSTVYGQLQQKINALPN